MRDSGCLERNLSKLSEVCCMTSFSFLKYKGNTQQGLQCDMTFLFYLNLWGELGRTAWFFANSVTGDVKCSLSACCPIHMSCRTRSTTNWYRSMADIGRCMRQPFWCCTRYSSNIFHDYKRRNICIQVGMTYSTWCIVSRDVLMCVLLILSSRRVGCHWYLVQPTDHILL